MGEMTDSNTVPFNRLEVTVEYLALVRVDVSLTAEAGGNAVTGNAVREERFQNAVYLPWRRGTGGGEVVP